MRSIVAFVIVTALSTSVLSTAAVAEPVAASEAEESETSDDEQTSDEKSDDAVEEELRQMEQELLEDPEQEDETPTDDTSDVDQELREMERDLGDAPEDDEADPFSLPSPTDTTRTAPQSMNPDISAIADFAFSHFSDEPDLRGGHDPVDQGFNLQGVELALQSAVDPYFRFDSYIVFSLFGVEVEEAYATTLSLPANLQLRAGQFKTNFGRTNPTHLHTWNFTNQALVLGKFFGGEGLRGLGLEVSQLLPLPWFAEWSLAVQNIGGASTGRSWLGSPGDVQDPTDLGITPRVEQYWDLTPNLGTLLGFSSTFGPNDTGRDNRSEVYGADLLLNWNPPGTGGHREIGLQNELMLRRRQTPGDAGDDEGTVLQDFGGYSELYYSPSLFWRFAGRYEFVSGVDDDYLDPEWDEDRHRVAANISYFPSHFSRIRLEHNVDFMPYRTDLDELVHMTMLQFEVVVGAHGAHQF